jgi:hypothetical protein
MEEEGNSILHARGEAELDGDVGEQYAAPGTTCDDPRLASPRLDKQQQTQTKR